MRLINTRPADDAASLTASLAQMGHTVVEAPLMTIRYDEDADLDLTDAQALLATSANGIRAFARRTARRDIAVFAVGDATARAAEQAGFQQVRSAAGDVAALAELVIGALEPAAGVLVHAAGSRLAGDLAGALEEAGFEVRRAVLYGAETATELPTAAAAALSERSVDGVLLYSPRTAATFADLVRRATLEDCLSEANVFCLSQAVAEKIADLPWRAVCVAERPEQDALIELLNS